METPTIVLVMLFALLFVGGLEFRFARSIDSNVSFIKSERKALLKFKQSLFDESNRLASWVGEDYCTWKGVSCSSKASHVVKLDLHNPTLFDFGFSVYDSDPGASVDDGVPLDSWDSDYEAYETNYSKTCLGGEVNPSLLNLKHLRYLDLSMNNFSGIQIPKFLGSLKNLRYLNISNARFVGKIPHDLGNLSSLQYLDLGYNELTADSLSWVSMLSSIKHLDLAFVDLSEAADWFHAINMLPSLLELNLQYCSVSSIPLHFHVNITSLVSLDLGFTSLGLNSGFIESFPLWLSNISGLVHLSLDGNSFGGPIFDTLGTLTSLTTLDLSGNYFDSSNPSWLCKLKNIVYLNLSDNLFKSLILPCLGNLTSLVIFSLSGNSFKGSIPSEIGNSKQLEVLDLSSNEFEHELPDTIKNLCNLRVFNLFKNKFSGEIPSFVRTSSCLQNSLTELNLQSNDFNGTIPSEMGNFSQLTLLDLSHNEFQGEIPIAMWHLCNLRRLDLSNNQLGGEIPIFVRSTFDCPQRSLMMLRLEYNKLSGAIPDHFGDLKNLKYLFLHDNSFSGPIPKSIGRLLSLRRLDISNNRLNGSVPPSLGQLSKLKVLDISNNSLVGMLSELHFAKLASLKKLCTSLNSLVLKVSSEWVPPFQLQTIDMASCKLGLKFPPWLQTQRYVEVLKISNARISDTIPEWFVHVYSRIRILDISENQISGKLPKFQELDPIDDERHLILKSNQFEGSLTSFPRNVGVLDLSNNLLSGKIPLVDDDRNLTLSILILSNNHLTGGIPMYLCNITTLQVIDFSKNRLLGRLPWCIGDLRWLMVLDLTNNSLSGDIPSSLGSLQFLLSIHLHNNWFYGKLPSSLKNLTYLRLLDLGNNQFSGIIPPWIGENLYFLKFLSLQSNKFSGEIPTQLCYLSTLHLINLAQNNLTGKIPHCFGNFTGMAVKNEKESGPNSTTERVIDGPYKDKILDTMKGRELEYTSEIPFLTSMDLSNNHIVGEIPEELMNLSALLNLNLAGNYLEGTIPERIGNLIQLLYLDLSRNKLSGPIPQSLADLNFLSHLNLSWNNLSGMIPVGNQLQTFDNQSYMGNNKLCGAPLLSCHEPDDSHKHVCERKYEDSDGILWFYAGIGPGSLVGFLGVCAILHFKKSWRYAYFQFLGNTYNRLSIAIAVKLAWFQRKFHEGKHER